MDKPFTPFIHSLTGTYSNLHMYMRNAVMAYVLIGVAFSGSASHINIKEHHGYFFVKCK